jgi:hypothetical protein
MKMSSSIYRPLSDSQNRDFDSKELNFYWER